MAMLRFRVKEVLKPLLFALLVMLGSLLLDPGLWRTKHGARASMPVERHRAGMCVP